MWPWSWEFLRKTIHQSLIEVHMGNGIPSGIFVIHISISSSLRWLCRTDPTRYYLLPLYSKPFGPQTSLTYPLPNNIHYSKNMRTCIKKSKLMLYRTSCHREPRRMDAFWPYRGLSCMESGLGLAWDQVEGISPSLWDSLCSIISPGDHIPQGMGFN